MAKEDRTQEHKGSQRQLSAALGLFKVTGWRSDRDVVLSEGLLLEERKTQVALDRDTLRAVLCCRTSGTIEGKRTVGVCC